MTTEIMTPLLWVLSWASMGGLAYAVLIEFFPKRSRTWAWLAIVIVVGGSASTIYYKPLMHLSAYWWIGILALAVSVGYHNRAAFKRATLTFARLQDALEFFDGNKATITRTLTQAPYVPLIPSNREPLYSLLLHDHGYGFENRELVWDIEEDGTITFHETNSLVVQTGRCDKVPHFMADVPIEPGTTATLDHLEREGYRMLVTNGSRQARHYSWEIEFRPALEAGRRIQYGYTVRLPRGAFPLRASEVTASCKPEYWFRSAIPCGTFEVRIVFPRAAEPRLPTFDVWPGSVQGRHEMEYARLVALNSIGDGHDNWGRYYIRLRLTHPLMGPTYVLRWTPFSEAG